jgi:hypothetical protein
VSLMARSEAELSRNHLTELLDFSRHGSYSQPHNRIDRTPDQMRGHHRRIAGGRRKDVAGPQSHDLRLVTPGRGSLERRTPPEPQPGAFCISGRNPDGLAPGETSVLSY